MKIEKQTVERLAHLARLKLSDAQVEELQQDLGSIIGWIEKLNEIDTDDVDPLLSMSHELNRWRDDEKINPLDRQEVISRAPDSDGEFIRVPKVI